jgi:integrase
MKLFKRDSTGRRLPATSEGFKSAPWYCKFSVGGRSYTRGLGTPDAAAARKIATKLRWEAQKAEHTRRFDVLDACKLRSPQCSTIGELVDAYSRLSRIRSAAHNVNALLNLTQKGTAKPYLILRDLPISTLDRSLVLRYQAAAVPTELPEGDAKRSATTSANSIVRQARSVTSRAMVEDGALADAGVRLPDLTGWRAAKLLKEPKHSFIAIPATVIDAIWSGAPALKDSEPQVYAALLLALCCGLRRAEACRLRWSDIYETKPGQRVIRLGISKNGQPRLVPLPDAIWSELRGQATVVPIAQPVDPGQTDPTTPDDARAGCVLAGTWTHAYRDTFDALAVWLRSKGLVRVKAAHELRKYCGSQWASAYGTRTAALLLGNTEQVCAAHYDALLSMPDMQQLTLSQLLGQRAEPSSEPSDSTHGSPQLPMASEPSRALGTLGTG